MSLIEKARDYMMSRRSFLGATATLAAGAAAAITLPGCGLQKVDSEKAAELAKKKENGLPLRVGITAADAV